MHRAWIVERKGVSPVIATILMVAITVVLTAVLYVMVSGYMGGTTGGEPYVMLTAGSSLGDRVDVAVDRAEPLHMYKVYLYINETRDLASSMETLTPGSFGNLTFIDGDGGGRLSTGDTFNITLVPGTRYELLVFWKQTGAKVGSYKIITP
ncbi:MAG: archaellin/type IV pilin N-terminal domain-containing protein [Candidatus Thermoplasmatota archaeon]